MAQGVSVRIEGLKKSFDRVDALKGLNLEIAPSELFTLLGPSGCGKTTLLRLIAGLEKPDSGRIFFDDEDVTDLPPHKRKIALVFQSYALFPFLNVFDNIAYGLRILKLSKKEIEERVREAISLVRLEGMEKRRIDQLSGGQRQRVAVARAIVIRPRVLLMDEPLSNLDAKLRVEMRSDIKQLQRRLNTTTIYVTHDQEEALSISTRIGVMSSGRLLQIGTPMEIYSRPKNSFVADFIGSTNILPAKLIKREDKYIVSCGTWKIRIGARPPFDNPDIKLSIRPEKIIIDKDSHIPNAVLASVYEIQYLGKSIRYKVGISGFEGQITVETFDSKEIKEGEEVYIGVDEGDIHFLED